MNGPRIALIHAVAVAIDPIRAAFDALWPEARPFNLLDDALSPDRERSAALAPELHARIVALAHYAGTAEAAGILYTCSAFGPAIEAARAEVAIPVLKPNEAMFVDALKHGSRIGMLATFAPSVVSMEDEFQATARAHGIAASVRTVCVPAAMSALKAGDRATHDAILADAVPGLGKVDAIMLAHFSTSRAMDAVCAVTSIPVLAAPRSAVLAMRARLEAR